ncbi:hypothetical protein [Prosthecobacter sp.]|uniref:hypothetical protein n=1 Tax=Prosthecobacter sp. TaxID=1965333 RepID=UPI001E065ADB|nr:hypothetical protein [Prosthecobacter sp.]MCB1276047.1 hypothetical protein [Prosthecobacter sp.]
MIALSAGLIELDVYFTAFIDVSNQRINKDGPREPPKDDVPLSDPAEMDVVIEARMLDLLDHDRVR